MPRCQDDGTYVRVRRDCDQQRTCTSELRGPEDHVLAGVAVDHR